MNLALFLTPTFTRLAQGAIVSKFLGLLAAGWNVHLFTPNDGVQNWFYSAPADQPQVAERIHELKMAASGATWLQAWGDGFRHPLHSVQNWRRSRQLLDLDAQKFVDGRFLSQFELLQPDLIHFECGFSAAKWHFLPKVLNCPMTVSLQAGELDFLVGPGFFGKIWQEAAGIHLPSESARQAALRYGLPASLPYAVIPPAVDETFYDLGERPYLEKVGSPERPLRLLSICKLAWSKGLEHALMVVRLLLDQGIHCEYDIIGSGPYADALHFAKMQLGVDGVVRFWGNQPRAQVRASLASADVFLHTAVAEGFCYAALEAQAMQLPVVCSDADGLPEFVAHEQTGFILPRRDIQAMAEKIALLAENPVLRQQMGQAGRRRIKTQFQAARQSDAFADFYQKVLAGSQ